MSRRKTGIHHRRPRRPYRTPGSGWSRHYDGRYDRAMKVGERTPPTVIQSRLPWRRCAPWRCRAAVGRRGLRLLGWRRRHRGRRSRICARWPSTRPASRSRSSAQATSGSVCRRGSRTAGEEPEWTLPSQAAPPGRECGGRSQRMRRASTCRSCRCGRRSRSARFASCSTTTASRRRSRCSSPRPASVSGSSGCRPVSRAAARSTPSPSRGAVSSAGATRSVGSSDARLEAEPRRLRRL
jgi:hypothetical protein